MRGIATLIGLASLALSGAAAAQNITLKKVGFPNTLNGTTGPASAPATAPLSQPVVFEFSGSPSFPSGVSTSIRISVDPSNSKGQPVGLPAFGEFEIEGSNVVFRPRLPKDPVPDGFGPGTDISSDVGMPGLLPDTIYRIEIPIGTPNSITNLKSSKVALPMQFATKPAVAGPELIPSLFSNAVSKPPKVNKDKVKPKPGISGLHPNLFNDPAGLFTSIPKEKKPPFKLKFNAPVDPQADNISASKVRVRAILDASGLPVDNVIATEVMLTANTESGATLQVYPVAILPFGHTIVVELSDLFRSLLGNTKNDGTTPEKFQEIARYKVANDPAPGQPIDDFLYEDFDDVTKQDPSIGLTEGLQVAGWDAANNDVLKASFGFGGDGSLGRFLPPDITLTINLDTDFQLFPLFSGATPDAPPGTTVKGGQFHFTDFHLPPNVTLRARGNNPFVITCTGECIIEGLIDANGADGTPDDTFDSAITSAPGGTGGPGAGRGGDGHPVKLPAGGGLQAMQTPQFGQSGSGPKIKSTDTTSSGSGGGGGGQCGASMPWAFTSSACSDSSIASGGSRGSGGGGGSFNVFNPNVGATQTGGNGPEPNEIPVSGRRGAIGLGNHLPVTFDPALPIPNEPAAYQATAGNPTNAVAKPNPNLTFAQAKAVDVDGNGQSDLIYDQTPFLNTTTTWATGIKVTLFGDPGPAVFTDSDPENNFIGPGGELAQIRGGQGGGGGGSRTEGMSQICKAVIFTQLKLPFTVNDAKGAGGGGGGGAVMIQALGPIEFRGNEAKISARGGMGAGAEEIEDSSRGGASGGGSGGCVILQSATAVIINDSTLPLPYAIDVSPGPGLDAGTLIGTSGAGTTGGEPRTLQVADGAPGGPGIVQIHAPPSSWAQVDGSKIGANVNYSMFNIGSGTGVNDGIDPFDPLVALEKTPTPLTPSSTARSTWYDLGLITSDFRPPILTSAGALAGPIFGVPGEGPFFLGTDKDTGLVQTDGAGNVVDPFDNDISVDSPDVLKADFIPNAAPDFQSVKVEFQGADEDLANPGLPDVASATPWVTDVTQVNGMRFVRWQITFDIATNPAFPVQPSTPRPEVNFLRVPFKY